jgi:peroxiredoxin
MSFRKLLAESGGLALLIAVLVGSLTLNVVLGWKVGSFTTNKQALRRASVQEHILLPAIPALTLEGTREWITFSDSRPTVLYILSPSCSWCERNEANIEKLALEKNSQYRFVGLSISGVNLQEYVSTRSLPFPVVLVDSKELIQQLGLGISPQTVVISSDGRVQKVWTGAFQDKQLEEIERFFGVELPGLTPGSSP